MINDLKDLQKLFKLCRAQGILDFKMNGIEIKFGDLPQKQSQVIDEMDENPSDEDLLYYSSAQGQQEIDKKVGML